MPTLNGPFVGYQWISGTQPAAKEPLTSFQHKHRVAPILMRNMIYAVGHASV